MDDMEPVLPEGVLLVGPVELHMMPTRKPCNEPGQPQSYNNNRLPRLPRIVVGQPV